MSIISDCNQIGDRNFGHVVSAPAGPTDLIDFELPEVSLPHSFLGIKMLDSNGDPIGAGIASGEFTVMIALDVTNVLEAPIGSVRDASNLVSLNVAGPIRRIQVVVSSPLSAEVASWMVAIQSFKS